jgi:hypothetical protein
MLGSLCARPEAEGVESAIPAARGLHLGQVRYPGIEKPHEVIGTGRKDYKMLERHFWKSVTMNPPLYGADTPMSLFDPHCKGWALSNLIDLLKQKGVPEIPGVTTPMSYFGMWKVRYVHAPEEPD